MNQHRALLLRGNRFLGSALVDAGLISVEVLDQATQKLLEILQAGNMKQASLLYVLLFEMKLLKEEALVTFLLDEKNLPLVDLRNVDITKTFDPTIDLSLCWATWTLPFDKVEDVWFVATAYSLSVPIIKHWETLLQGRVIWYGASLAGMNEALDRLEAAGIGKPAAEEAPAAPAAG